MKTQFPGTDSKGTTIFSPNLEFSTFNFLMKWPNFWSDKTFCQRKVQLLRSQRLWPPDPARLLSLSPSIWILTFWTYKDGMFHIFLQIFPSVIVRISCSSTRMPFAFVTPWWFPSVSHNAALFSKYSIQCILFKLIYNQITVIFLYQDAWSCKKWLLNISTYTVMESIPLLQGNAQQILA